MHRRLAALLIVLFAMSLCSPLVVAEQDNYPEGDAWIEIKLLHWEADSNHTWDSDSSAPDPRFKFCIEADGTQIDCIQSDTWANSWNLSNVWNFTVDIPDTSTNLSFSIECKDNDALNDDECDMSPNDGEWRGIHSLNWTSLGNQTHYFSTFSPWGGNDSQPSAHADWSISVSGFGDSDNDGVPDNLDLCNEQTTEPLIQSGCSWAQLDFDHDGFANAEDKYPYVPLSSNEFAIPSQAVSEGSWAYSSETIIGGTVGVYVADVNGDGADEIRGESGAYNPWCKISWLYNTGCVEIDVPYDAHHQFADINGDGYLEAFRGSWVSDVNGEYLNSVPGCIHDDACKLVDLGRDGVFDLISISGIYSPYNATDPIAEWDCERYSVRHFYQASTQEDVLTCQETDSGDLTNSVVYISENSVSRIELAQFSSSGFQGEEIFASIADVDLDGYADVIKTCQIALGNGQGSPSFTSTITPFTCKGPIMLEDLDSDGDVDMWFSNGYATQSETGFTLTSLQRGSDFVGNKLTQIGDVDGNGYLDIVVYQKDSRSGQNSRIYSWHSSTPPCSDLDFDGICDEDDECDQSTGPVDSRGCSSNQRDTDGDGVLDSVDQCPDTETQNLSASSYGCDETQTDSDLDGIYDNRDLCPGTLPNVNVMFTGCSYSQSQNLDSDEDGVTDGVDLCPETLPASVVDESGCSDEQSASVDTDGDGLSDTYETNISGTSPTLADSDNDGLSDFEELFEVRSDPNNADSDFDGYSDGDEIQSGSDPMDTSSTPYADSESNIWWNVLCCGVFILAGLLTFGVIDLKSKPNQTNTAPQHMVRYQPERATHIARLERERAEAASNLQRLQNSLNAQQAQSEETAQLRQQMMNMQAHLNSIAAERAQLEHEVQRVRQEAEAEKAELSEKLAKNAPQTVIQNITYNVHDSSIVADEFGRVTGGEESSK